MNAIQRPLPRARLEATEGLAELADLLRAEIRQRGLNQAQAADAIGVSLSRLREWLESNPPRPTPDACEAIARFIGRPPAEVRRLAGRRETSVSLPARAARPEVVAFCDRLSSELDRRGLSRAKAAAAIGVHPRTMANWFGPHPRRPLPQICDRLAQFLGVDYAEVRSWAGYPAEQPEAAARSEPTREHSGTAHAIGEAPRAPLARDLSRLNENQRDRVMIRLAVMQAAGSFLAHRPEMGCDDVEEVAARWEAWVLEAATSAPPDDRNGDR